MTMTEHIRILVADDHPLLRQGVVQVIAAEPDFVVVGEAGSDDETVALVRALRPDLVLIDLDMPRRGGLAAIEEILASCPEVRILVLTVSEDVDHLTQALRAGAKGYVVKGVSGDGLVYAVRVVAGGDLYVSRSLAGAMFSEMTRKPDPIESLTDRERSVLELLAEGLSNREIASRLFLAEKTIKHYMTGILQKLQVKSRLEAALLAQRSQVTGKGAGDVIRPEGRADPSP
jgi:two-component system, NarL family, nitrate/nitrite response regulator NarL